MHIRPGILREVPAGISGERAEEKYQLLGTDIRIRIENTR